MNLDDQISRSLAHRADQTSYDATPLATIEQSAHGIRRRRRVAAAVGVAAVVVAAIVPLALVRGGSSADPLPPATSPTVQVSTTGPLGYLSKGLYHPSSGGDPIAVDIGNVSAVAEVGDDIVVVSYGGAALEARYTRLDPSGRVVEEGCTTGPAVSSPSGETVAWAHTICPENRGSAYIAVNGPSGDAMLPIVGSPIVLGVDDAGDEVVYVEGSGSGIGANADDVVHMLGADGADRTVPGIHRVLGYDPVGEVLFGSLTGTDAQDPGTYVGGAVNLGGDILWSLEATSVSEPSPDGRFVIGADVPRQSQAYPPPANSPSLNPRLLDATTGETVAALPEQTADGAVLTSFRWDDDEHVLAEAFSDDERRFVRIALDGTITDAHPELTADPDVIFESR